MAKLTGKESTLGLMVRCTMESGKTVPKRATECGMAFSETPTSANGKILKLMAMACILGKMGTNTKVSGKLA